jgi:hypothetical protein
MTCGCFESPSQVRLPRSFSGEQYPDDMPLVAVLAAGVLWGTATIGPLTPFCRVDTPCGGPARNATLTFTRPGRSISTHTDARGRYRVRLPVGVWYLRASVGMFVRPVHVRVVVGTRRLDVAIDTGIR